MSRRFLWLLVCLAFSIARPPHGAIARSSQIVSATGLKAAPPRRPGEGLGPFDRLVIRRATIVDGTGAPPYGPADIVIARNRIVVIQPSERARPSHSATFEIDAAGMYVLPGFIEMHGHGGATQSRESVEYAYKLWLAHGVTTVRGVPFDIEPLSTSEAERSHRNEIVAPRIFNYHLPGVGWDEGDVDSPEKARAYVHWAADHGIDGLKLHTEPGPIFAALTREAERRGLGTVAHLWQTGVAQMNAVDAARAGLQSVTHFYGHFEALLRDYTVQPWPPEMNYRDEQLRFREVARLHDKIHPPGSPAWVAYLQQHLSLGTVFDPTLSIYSANRDVMRARNADWHRQYTLPSLAAFFVPSRTHHGSNHYDWTTEDEAEWRRFYQVWMRLLTDYKRMGGRVTTGSDAPFSYQTYGFGYILELEMLQEAGFHPLEVVQAATLNGALTLFEPKGKPIQFGAVREGLLADLIVIEENPLKNFKVLYGTGAMTLDGTTGTVGFRRGIKYTIKDGVVYDVSGLLSDVRAMVDRER